MEFKIGAKLETHGLFSIIVVQKREKQYSLIDDRITNLHCLRRNFPPYVMVITRALRKIDGLTTQLLQLTF